MMNARSIWLIMAGFFMSFSEVSCAWSYHRKAVPIEAGESICSLSRKLKEVAPWTQEKIADLRKTSDEYGSKLVDWKLHFHPSPECGENESLLDSIRTALENVNKEIETIPAKAIRVGALAAKSAGRLDEFITVFYNAQKISVYGTSKYCLGSKGDPATKTDLLDCFPGDKKLELGEANLAKIPETTMDTDGPDLVAVIKKLNHSTVALYVRRVSMDDAHADCNLIKGKSGGILDSTTLSGPLWWGGGILTIGKDFDGNFTTNCSKFIAGEIANASKDASDKAFWTSSPTIIPHLNKTLAAFQAFKDSAARITQKFTEIERIEKQIEPCLSNETMEEGPTQSCFKSAVKLNAELHAANALLARYHKEKGPLPSGSTLILHQSGVHFLYLIASLL